MDQPTFPEIEIFRAGRHVDVNGLEVEVTHADLAAIAAAYDPSIGEAPHVVGHPKLDAPAYGWVQKLDARDGVLYAAQSGQVEASFAGMVEAGRFKKRSASFFLPKSPGNPKPGGWYLRHVGWLGAAAPAVSGLRDVSFAGDVSGVVEFSANTTRWALRDIADLFRRVRDYVIESAGLEKADTVIPDWRVNSIADAATQTDEPVPSFAAPAAITPTESATMSEQQTVDFAAREAAINTRQADIAKREAALREQEDKARRAGVVEFATGLVTAGKLLPRQQAPVVELLVALESAATPQALSFAAPDGSTTTAPAGETLRTLLNDLPVQVDFAERSAHQGEDVEAIAFAAPAGTQVDNGRLAIDAKARAYMRQHPNTPYVAAVRAVGG